MMEIPVCYILKLRALGDIDVKGMLKSKCMYAHYFYVHKVIEEPRFANFLIKTKSWAWQGHYSTKVKFFGGLFSNPDIYMVQNNKSPWIILYIEMVISYGTLWPVLVASFYHGDHTGCIPQLVHTVMYVSLVKLCLQIYREVH